MTELEQARQKIEDEATAAVKTIKEVRFVIRWAMQKQDRISREDERSKMADKFCNNYPERDRLAGPDWVGEREP